MLFMVLFLCLLQNASALAAFDDYFSLNPMYRGKNRLLKRIPRKKSLHTNQKIIMQHSSF